MKRLGILAFYDKDGIVDEYVFYLVNSIKDVVDDVIIVINGSIVDESLLRMKAFSKRIFIRKNLGFDGGAYKDVFTQYLSPSELLSYDEIVMMNSTFFGPFFEWNKVFSRMDGIACDFWGLTCNHGGGHVINDGIEVTEHVQSYFMVLRHSIICSKYFMEFWNELKYPATFKEAIENFEIGFSTFFMKKGFHHSSFSDLKKIDWHIAYQLPMFLKENGDFPIFKLRAFYSISDINSVSDFFDCIKENTNYDVTLIQKCRPKQKDAFMNATPFIDRCNIFCNTHPYIYIYGHGKIGKNIGRYFNSMNKPFVSYLVTHIDKKTESIYGPVKEFSSADFLDGSGIIVAMGRKNTAEVLPLIKKKFNKEDIFTIYEESNMKKESVIVYGIGKAYIQNISLITENFTVKAIVDKTFDSLNDEKLKELSEKYKFSCMKRKDAVETFFNTDIPFIITSNKFFSEIQDELTALGINKKNIKAISQIEMLKIEKSINFSFLNRKCIDIGGPSSIFAFIYDVAGIMDIVNFSKENTWGSLANDYCYKDRVLGKVIENDATDLKDIPSESYDVVLSSNNLEHIANPLKAVKEWVRILRKDGIIYIFVPCKDYTFDHKRKVVTFEHLLDDFKNNVGEDDLSHLEEILSLHDLKMDPPAGTFEEFKARSLKNFENRCLHQHVFDYDVLSRIAEYFELSVLPADKLYLGNWVLVARKIKC